MQKDEQHGPLRVYVDRPSPDVKDQIPDEYIPVEIRRVGYDPFENPRVGGLIMSVTEAEQLILDLRVAIDRRKK
jgi:hypothetical protein